MATSGSYDFTASRDQIITRSLRMLGVVPQGDSATASQVAEAAEALNSMVKYWQNEHIFLWTQEWVTKTFTASSTVTGTDGNIYTCIRSHTSASSNRPVTGADYTTYWHQIGSTGGTWATSTAYSAIGDFAVAADTIDITSAFLRITDNDWPVEVIRMEDYLKISDKFFTGRTSSLALQKALAPRVYLWPQPDQTDYVLHYHRVRKLEDFDLGANTPDFPERWIDPLVFGLAAQLGPEYGLRREQQQYLDAKAAGLRTVAKANDSPSASGIFAQPAYEV